MEEDEQIKNDCMVAAYGGQPEDPESWLRRDPVEDHELGMSNFHEDLEHEHSAMAFYFEQSDIGSDFWDSDFWENESWD